MRCLRLNIQTTVLLLLFLSGSVPAEQWLGKANSDIAIGDVIGHR